MRSEVKELYFADDGTPFEENKEACEVYDHLYHKVYQMIEYGKVLFWNYKGELVRSQLLNYTWNADDKLCYYDWLMKCLHNIAYFRISVNTETAEFDEIWGLLCGLLDLKGSKERNLYNHYRTGDTCVFDSYICKYINQDDVIRNFNETKKDLDGALSKDFKKFMEGLCK